VAYTGTLTGTSTVHGTLIFHPDGTANFHDVETFTGTVNGVAGTVTFNLNGSSDPALVVSATNVIVSATGGLADLHGVLSESAVVLDKAVGPVGTYTGQIQSGKP
jgi:phage baseplate assembly protein gpV